MVFSFCSTTSNITKSKCMLLVVTMGTLIGFTFIGEQLTVIKQDWNIEDVERYLRADFINIKLTEPRKPFIFTMEPWKINSAKPRSQKFLSFKKDTRWSMVTIVKSMPSDTKRRQIARETWASYEYIDGIRFETIFIVGNSKTKEEQIQLQRENDTHGDILQMVLEEKYINIVYKTLGAMQYVGDHFPSNWMFSSADDDVLPNLFTMGERISEMLDVTLKQDSSPESNCSFSTHIPVFCGFEYVQKPMTKRNGGTKWDISKKDYPIDSYPSCCRGAWYTMSVAKAKSFYFLSTQFPAFWIEDIFVTSFLRLKYYDNIKGNCVLSSPSVGIWTKYRNDEVLSVHGDGDLLLTAWNGFKEKIIKKTYIKL